LAGQVRLGGCVRHRDRKGTTGSGCGVAGNAGRAFGEEGTGSRTATDGATSCGCVRGKVDDSTALIRSICYADVRRAGDDALNDGDGKHTGSGVGNRRRISCCTGYGGCANGETGAGGRATAYGCSWTVIRNRRSDVIDVSAVAASSQGSICWASFRESRRLIVNHSDGEGTGLGVGAVAESVAVQVTVVTPLRKVPPLAGEQDTVTPPEQLSVAVGVV
jgi:hypothetical protein